MSKRFGRTFVIDEDQHLENLRKIIKRDFFGTATSKEEAETMKTNLDGYLSSYKSNQNQFFSEMVQANNQEWKDKHWWIEKQDKMLMAVESQKFKALPYHNMLQNNQQLNGINTSITKQDAKNSLFFNREKNFGSLQSQQHAEGKKVVYKNCKFDDPVSRMRAQLAVKQEQITPMREVEEQGRSEEKEKGDSPLPEEADGHMMTWGEIESTPMRISGPEFKIPDTPQREQLLSEMNNKIKKQKKDVGKKSELAKKILGSLTPSYNSSRQRIASSIRRVDSMRRDKDSDKNDLSGLLNIKKK